MVKTMQNKVCFEPCSFRFLVSFVATLHFCLLLALVPSPLSLISYLVILANAGTHRAASGMAWYYRFIASVNVGLFYVVYFGEYVSKRGIWRVWLNGFPCARE